MHYQRYCDSWTFSLFLVTFFPISPFNCQFYFFTQFHAQLCVRNEKISCASHRLNDAKKIFTDVDKKNREEIDMYLSEGGRLELLAKIFTLTNRVQFTKFRRVAFVSSTLYPLI